MFQDECDCELSAINKPPPSTCLTSASPPTTEILKMGAGEDVGPTPSQTEEMRSRLKSHIAENGSGEFGK